MPRVSCIKAHISVFTVKKTHLSSEALKDKDRHVWCC